MAERRPDKRAAALQYNPATGMNAPVVLASGVGRVAERILEIARSENIPVHEDAALVELLAKVEPGSEIPDELFAAVAEVLAYLYRTGKRARPEQG